MFGNWSPLKNITPKQRVIKNFVGVSLSFLLIFASSDDISSVTSILNQDEGLGNTTLAIAFACQLCFSFVLPQLIIELFGFKLAFVFAEICYIIYFLAYTFPSWFTLIPAAFIVGYSSSQVWTTMGIYFTVLSKKYALITETTFLSAQTMIFGWFGILFFFNRLIGSVWLGTILQLRELPQNITFDYAENCGAKNYPRTKLPEATSRPTAKSVYILFGTIIASGVCALIITLLLVDDVKTTDQKSSEEMTTVKREKVNLKLIKSRFVIEFKNVFNIAKQLDIWLLMPITFYLGFELTFIWFEYPRAFVSCLKNVNYIGWCIMVYAVTASIVSYLNSLLTKHTGVQTMMVVMLLVALCQCIFVISWTPRVSQAYVIFIMALTFGFTQSLANTQIRAVYGVFFPKDPAAYTGAIVFETIGLAVGSVMSIFLQTRVKTYVYMGVILVSLLSYIWLEARHAKELMLIVDVDDVEDVEVVEAIEKKIKADFSSHHRATRDKQLGNRNEAFQLEYTTDRFDDENVVVKNI